VGYRFVVLEDDFFDWEWTRDTLMEAFPGVDLMWIVTESSFEQQFDELAKHPPDLFVLDIMVPWDRPKRGQDVTDVPDAVREEGFYTAGFRCLERLRQNPALASVPYVLYTGLDTNNFSEYVVHTKSTDMRPLVDEIRRQLHKNPAR
jgi:CheY-like chemotaxis protein